METNHYRNANMLDMIFENRNKAYGAYVLRRDYNKSLQQAMFITISSVLLLFFGQLMKEKLTKNFTPDGIHVNICPLPEVFKQHPNTPKPQDPPKPPKSNSSQPARAIANIERRVVADNHTPDSIPGTDQLLNHDIGLTTNNSAPLGGLSVPGGTGTGQSLQPSAPVISQNQDPTRTPDVMPVFPGGEKALLAYLSGHTQFPAQLKEMGIGGRVVSEFTVNEDGSVSDVKILKSPDSGFDKEVTRVVKSLPAFTPGLQGGHAVKVRYVVPMVFTVKD